MDEIKSKIIDLVASCSEIEIEKEKLADDTNLITELGIDSIKMVEFIVKIETTFGVNIPDDMMLGENFSTINKTIEIVREIFKQ